MNEFISTEKTGSRNRKAVVIDSQELLIIIEIAFLRDNRLPLWTVPKPGVKSVRVL